MQTDRPSLGFITFVYAGYYVIMAIAISAALWALERFVGFAVEPNAVSALPMILGAMFAGQYYGKKAGAKSPQSYAWVAGLLFMLASLILSVMVMFGVALVMGLQVGATIAALRAEMGDDAGLIAAIIGGVLVFIWVVLRFMFSLGAGQAVKLAARQAAQGK